MQIHFDGEKNTITVDCVAITIRSYKNGPVTVCVFACPKNDGGEVHIPTASGVCNVCKTTYAYSTCGLIALKLTAVPNSVTVFPVVTYA